MCKGYYTKLQNVLMGFIHISYKLLKETVGKAFLNRRCVQFQVLKSSVKKKVSKFLHMQKDSKPSYLSM